MTMDLPVLVIGGPWKDCLGIVQYKAGKHDDIYIVYIDKLGTVALKTSEMREVKDEDFADESFNFADPNIIQAEFNLELKSYAYHNAKEKYERALHILEECKNGERYNAANA